MSPDPDAFGLDVPNPLRGTWAQSHEFVPTSRLAPAPSDLGLIEQV